MSAVHVKAGDGVHYVMIDGDHVAKTAVRDDSGAFEVFEVLAPVAPMAPVHVSPWTGVMYVLEGRVSALVDGTQYEAAPGDLVVMPAGSPCTFGVLGESARFLAITSGEGAGRFFADFARSVPVAAAAADTTDAIVSVTSRHGVSMVGSSA